MYPGFCGNLMCICAFAGCLTYFIYYFFNEEIEVTRVCLIQGQEQQQNWVLKPSVLAPYPVFFFFLLWNLENGFSVSGAVVSALYQ